MFSNFICTVQHERFFFGHWPESPDLKRFPENLNIDSECAIIASLEAYELNSEDFS